MNLTKKSVLRNVLACVFLVIGVVSAGLLTNAEAGGRGGLHNLCQASMDELPNGSYKVNEYGQTYGSLDDSPSWNHLPDLIVVLATNGRVGYITKEDFLASQRMAEDPEHALRIMDEYYLNAATGFADYVLCHTGAQVDIGAAKILFKRINSFDRGAYDFYALSPENQAALLRLLPDDPFRAEAVAASAYEAALQANNTILPVYDVDGHTIIGEFIVG